MATKKTARKGGRPRTPESEQLVRYGLRLARDKKAKLLQLKEAAGLTVREWIEGIIEVEHRKLERRRG